MIKEKKGEDEKPKQARYDGCPLHMRGNSGGGLSEA